MLLLHHNATLMLGGFLSYVFWLSVLMCFLCVLCQCQDATLMLGGLLLTLWCNSDIGYVAEPIGQFSADEVICVGDVCMCSICTPWCNPDVGSVLPCLVSMTRRDKSALWALAQPIARVLPAGLFEGPVDYHCTDASAIQSIFILENSRICCTRPSLCRKSAWMILKKKIEKKIIMKKKI